MWKRQEGETLGRGNATKGKRQDGDSLEQGKARLGKRRDEETLGGTPGRENSTMEKRRD